MGNISELTAKIREKKQELENLIKKEGRQLLGEAFASFFEQFPKIDSVVWDQYTPYFNDGDVCTFSGPYNEVRITGDLKGMGLVEADPEDWNKPHDFYEEYDDGTFCLYGSEETGNSELVKEIDSFLTEFERIDDDILLALFGDHATVTAKRDGSFEVEECEHE